jgi:steroid 5-alpha reductase family enzyme
MDVLYILIIGWVFLIILMIATWCLSEYIGKAAIVDVVWAFSIGLLSLLYAVLINTGNSYRGWLVAIVTTLWSLRLGTHLLIRLSKEKDDKRYLEIIKSWGDQASRKMFWFFQFQGAANVVLGVVLLLAIANAASFPNTWDIAGIIIAGLAVLGEGISDWQLKQFKQDPIHKGKTCRRGLWRYSRHPNYFFEWIFWCSLPFFAVGHPLGWLGWLSPAAMLYILVKVTGIPPTEKQSLLSRGDDYRRYQKETSSFVPWFPKKPTTPIH